MHFGDYLQSDLLTRAGFAHVFCTRRGGVSTGAFASLNASPGVGDSAEHVAENLRRIALLLGIAAAQLCVPRQVHGRAVLVLEGHESATRVANLAADATVTGAPGLACAVRTADCVPILLADRATRRVAAIHAGWRGVAQNVVQATLDEMTRLGSHPTAIAAAIGPHICQPAFEVGEEVAAELTLASRMEGAVERAPGQKPRVDLAKLVVLQLAAAGVSSESIEQLPGCTYRDEHDFFSYRRDGKQSGRMLSAILSGVPSLARDEPGPRASQSGAGVIRGPGDP